MPVICRPLPLMVLETCAVCDSSRPVATKKRMRGVWQEMEVSTSFSTSNYILFIIRTNINPAKDNSHTSSCIVFDNVLQRLAPQRWPLHRLYSAPFNYRSFLLTCGSSCAAHQSANRYPYPVKLAQIPTLKKYVQFPRISI